MSKVLAKIETKFPSLLFQFLDDLLEDIGLAFHKQDILDNIHITNAQFLDPDFQLNRDQFLALLRLLKDVQKQTPPVQAVVKNLAWSNFDVLALAGMSSSTVLEATKIALKYGCQYFPYVSIDLQRGLHKSKMVVNNVVDFEEMSPAALEIFICGIKRFGEEFAENAFSSCSIHFSHPCWLDMDEQKATGIYSEFSGCPVHFNSSFNGFLATEETWQTPLSRANQMSQVAAIRLLDEKSNTQLMPEPMVKKAYGILHQYAEKDYFPSLQELADLLHISPRTLSRKLGKEGLQFKALLSEVKFERAKSLLLQSGNATRKIAARMGYSDLSTFTRAFKAHTGATPAQWRLNQKKALGII